MPQFTTCGLTILLAFAPAALAVDGIVLINQSTMTNGLPGCPTGGHFPIIICQSGSYRLSGSLKVPDANTTAIQITVSDVAIDLNGFSISGPGTKGSGSGIVGVDASVSNGTVRGMGSLGVLLNGNSRVYKIQAIGNGSDGIDAIGLVSECISSGNGGLGLRIIGAAMNNFVSSNAGDGISGSAVITGNAVYGNANGINAGASIISGNLVQQNTLFGVKAVCPSLLMGNQVSFNVFGDSLNGSLCLEVNDVP
jgi:hypothetical protein